MQRSIDQHDWWYYTSLLFCWKIYVDHINSSNDEALSWEWSLIVAESPAYATAGTENSDEARDFELPLKDRFYLQPLPPAEAAARAKESAKDILNVKELIDKKAWPYVMNDLRLRASYLRYDLNTVINAKPKEEKKPLKELTGKLFSTIDQVSSLPFWHTNISDFLSAEVYIWHSFFCLVWFSSARPCGEDQELRRSWEVLCRDQDGFGWCPVQAWIGSKALSLYCQSLFLLVYIETNLIMRFLVNLCPTICYRGNVLILQLKDGEENGFWENIRSCIFVAINNKVIIHKLVAKLSEKIKHATVPRVLNLYVLLKNNKKFAIPGEYCDHDYKHLTCENKIWMQQSDICIFSHC